MTMQPSVKDRSELVCEPPSSIPWPNLPPLSDGDVHSIRRISDADRHVGGATTPTEGRDDRSSRSRRVLDLQRARAKCGSGDRRGNTAARCDVHDMSATRPLTTITQNSFLGAEDAGSNERDAGSPSRCPGVEACGARYPNCHLTWKARRRARDPPVAECRREDTE